MAFPSFTSQLIDESLKLELAAESKVLQEAQAGIMSLEKQAMIDRSLEEQYGIETRPFVEIPEEIKQEYYGKAGQALEIIDPAGDFDRFAAQLRVKDIYKEYTRSPRQLLEEREVDPGGAPFNVQEDLADLPVDPSIDLTQAADLSLRQQFPGVSSKELDVSVDSRTGETIFKNPLTQQYTTLMPVGQNWMDAAGRWMRMEGDMMVASILPGLGASLGTLAVTKSPFLAGAVGIAGDVAGFTVFRLNNLMDLRERGLLDEKNWDNKKIWMQSLRDAIPIGIGSIAGVALTRMLTMWIKRLPKMDLNEAELVGAIEAVFKEKGLPFHDAKSAVKFLYEKQLAGELPPNMAAGDVPWEAYSTDKILEMARRVVDLDAPGAAIRPTTPQVMLQASEQLGLDVSGSPGKTSEVLQAALEAIRRAGGPLAKQAEDILGLQEQQMIKRYEELIEGGFKKQSTDINPLTNKPYTKLELARKANSTKFTGTGRQLDKILSERQIAEVDNFLGKIQDATTGLIDKVDNFTGKALTTEEAGVLTRSFWKDQIKLGEDYINAYHNALGTSARGAQAVFDPTPLVIAVKGVKKELSKKLLKSLHKEYPVLNDILSLEKLAKTTKGGREFKKISYQQIKGMVEDVNGLLEKQLPRNEYNVLIKLKEELMSYRGTALSTIGDDVAEMARLVDDSYSVFKETYKKGVVNKITKAASGSSSRYALPDSQVMEGLLLSGNKFDDDFVRSILMGNRPEQEIALKNVQSWLKGNFRELARQPGTDILDPSKITGRQLEIFMKKYGQAMKDYLPKGEFKTFTNLKTAIPTLRRNLDDWERELTKLRKDPLLGKAIDDAGTIKIANRPEFFFREIFGRELGAPGAEFSVAAISSLKNTVKILKRSNSKVAKEILDDLKLYTAKDMDAIITIKNSNGLIDPALFRSYINVMEEPLETLFGKKFVKGLGDYERMIRYLMPSGGKQVGAGAEGVQRILTGKQQSMIRVGNDITRAYIGIFTRPGRFLTAFLRTASTKQQKRLLDLMLNPDKIISEYGARQFFENPYVQMISRQWGELALKGYEEEMAPARAEAAEERLAPILIEEEKIKIFNTGGRVSPRLMPLRYGL